MQPSTCQQSFKVQIRNSFKKFQLEVSSLNTMNKQGKFINSFDKDLVLYD